MSRFGLRSSSDILKVSEDNTNRKKLDTDTKMSLRRNCQKKRKIVCLEKTEDLNEQWCQKEDNRPSMSIVCSLPLNRLTGFIEKLNTSNWSFGKKSHYSQQIYDNEEKIIEGINLCDNQSKADVCDNIGSNHQAFDECTSTLEESVRILCLYCDKKFTSFKMQLKHVEKFHIHQKNRRCSGRNSQMSTTSDGKKQRVEPCSVILAKYPGCTYCKRSKTHHIEASAKDLNGLFLHFIDCHSDKYFGCKACMQRFQNIGKLNQHMQAVHKDISLSLGDSFKNKYSDLSILEKVDMEKVNKEKVKSTKTRYSKPQRNVNVLNIASTSHEDSSPTKTNTVMGAEEPILSRLGLAQNRLPNNRKGVRSRKESILSESILKPDQPSVYTSAVKARNKSGKNAVRESGDAEVIFRMPTRTEMLSSSFDEHFYRDVISNVRNNLLYFLDGKLFENVGSAINVNSTITAVRHQMPTIRSTLTEGSVVLHESNALECEIHAATSLATSTAFPTLLTAEQYGGDAVISKIRRPHTKHSWKWKWDSVKKYKLINEGGKIVKKMKQPMLGLRDLSKLDMWTQLSMRQKHEMQQYVLHAHYNESIREEKQRINEQLNYILDMRLLPHIILEQNEQAIIKIENHEFGILSYMPNSEEDGAENILNQSFVDNTFFSILQLVPNHEVQCHRKQLVLSGEWARPRCYLCMCCGAKFEKLKSLEEHKMFRHSHVLSTHYEVVGRELLAGNSLRHLFIPNRALSYYGNDNYNNSNVLRKFGWRKSDLHDMSRKVIVGSIGDDDSSDSIPSTLNSCTINTYSAKHSTTDECDTDTKTILDINNGSLSNSMQSSNSLFATPLKLHAKCKERGSILIKCSKCTRRCSGTLDLYRHMLDCSGDYIWSLAKKRKYRYYCGSKKRRSWNKQNFTELRKKPPKSSKPSPPANDTEESVSSSKVKNPSRQRPSDAESIKKMLENLPPKRICKKIFPALTKTKKSKYKAKHKMFSCQGRMISTRARKISKLSKTKTKFANKVAKNKKILHHKSDIILVKRKSKKSTIADGSLECSTTLNTLSNNTDKENFRNLKNTWDKPPSTDVIMDNSETVNAETDLEDNAKTSTTPSKVQNEANDVSESTPIALAEGSVATGSRVCDSLRSNKSAQQVDLQTKASLGVSGNYETQNNLQFMDNTTCNKKRSKKINDCIAMLTGKLEEKLKTGQHSLSRDESCLETEVNCESKIKFADETKLPKRKAVSRKIIKIDDVTTQATLAATQKVKDATGITAVLMPKVSCTPFVVSSLTQKIIPVPTTSMTATTPNPIVRNNVNMNYIQNAMNINLLQQNNNSSLINKQATELITANMDSAISVLPPIPLASPNTNTAILLPKQSTSVLMDKIKKIAPTLPTPSPIKESVAHFPALPLSLPLQGMTVNVPPIQPPPPPPPVLSVLSQSSFLPTPVPLPPVVPVAPMTTVVHVAPLFNSEPLNLSNTKNIKKYNPNELVCLPPYRSAVPARRQTICGFEAKNFILEDEPLDLSKKSNKDQTNDVPAAVMPIIKPIELQNVHPVGINLTVAPHQDAPLNKQFYSNLELLKIPQIRNANSTTTTSETVFVSSIPKFSSKKRNGSKNNNEITSKQVPFKDCKGTNKEISANRKDNSSKGKASQKMDDEVINHIDDAINSVINAVKASLPDNDEEDNDKNKFNMNCNTQQIDPLVNLRTTAPVNQITQSQSIPTEQHVFIYQKSNEKITKNNDKNIKTMKSLVFLPQKRYVRSKTLDCRPSLLRATSDISDNLQHLPDEPVPEHKAMDGNIPEPSATTKLLETSSNSIYSPSVVNFTEALIDSPSADCKSKSTKCVNPLENCELARYQKTNNDISVCNATHINERLPLSLPQDSHNEVNKCVSPLVEVCTEINLNIITEENMSNINNTSSGFHSSGQLDNTVEAKKKQRRRRKNELAAIVADQLLESFKIDKTRRDNLKKLENLAYEKSEDLFVTGMLLMSSTKRNVTSSKTDLSNNDVNLNKKSHDTIKQKQDQTKVKTSRARHKQNTITEPFTTNNESIEKPKNEEIVNKRSKKRQYRSKSKPLDNENISKLKSSLESFSIGIEKQLTELEARNSAIITVSETKALNTSPVSVRSSLLRPSILSANIESNLADNRTALVESKSAISSRDPRLNKNIHKNEHDKSFESRECEKDKHLDEIGDVEEDNYLTEIAKNVNEKIMSSENEDFMFVNDGFELANELQDDSNSKFYSRPPTSMSVRSAPNFNDDRSNFGSICDENTNTEVMDMDLEDELSVYTSYSQDVGRCRGRRRRRRRSILLKRRPKKRVNPDSSADKFECTLCKKVFYSLNSLTKHNMTLAHVSKLSAQEYLLSKTLEITSTITPMVSSGDELQKCNPTECTSSKIPKNGNDMQEVPEVKDARYSQTHSIKQQQIQNVNIISRREPSDISKDKTTFNNSSRLNLNPDERLFFECCNILKGAETNCINNVDGNNAGSTFEYNFKDKTQMCLIQGCNLKSLRDDTSKKRLTPEQVICKPATSLHEFRSPALQSTIINKNGPPVTSQDQHSPNYSGVSQFSAVTNTASKFKTKAAMKGYENTNINLTLCKEVEVKSSAVCKLTELAEIALGNEKSNSPDFTTLSNQQEGSIFRQLTSRKYLTSSAAVDNPKNCSDGNGDRIKSNEAHSSTSSKTIMHSKIKAAIDENSKTAYRRIVIPDRPFKNIGLEEKETITFQKPKTTVNLLTDDNSVSTTTYSDRDDFDFGSLSCDEEPDPKASNERNVKNNSDSSSSRATAKTFENKSLIMDRIFKNMGTKAKTTVKVQSIGVQKDPLPKTDINQLFDELRGDCGIKVRQSENVAKKHSSLENLENLQSKQRHTSSQEKPVQLSRGPKETRRKSNICAKSQKEITRLQSELGMSQEEIVKLINEGQRKSKRRCATNRPKKLVEMWSSDEYEEFLSTKDIIALIEEKEKQETRKKRKTANQIGSSNKNKDIESPKQIPNRRKSARCITDKGDDRLEISTEIQKKSCSKTNGAAKTQINHVPIHSLDSKGKYTRSCTEAESDVKSRNSISSELNHKSTINNKKRKPSKGGVAFKSLNKYAKKASKIETSQGGTTKDVQLEKDNKTYTHLSDVKQTNSRTRNNKGKKYSECKDTVNSIKTLNKNASTSDVSRKHTNNVVNNTNNNNINNQSYKNRRKNQSSQSPPRRKRLASEKLYYWSSSSDEEFGKINSSCGQEFDGGEQYQKHGWIVGDSHKKLVTLLAITKGNKKVDTSCGVKKKVSRKKN